MGINTRRLKRKLKKRLKSKRWWLKYVGTALLAVATIFVVGAALKGPTPEPATVALPAVTSTPSETPQAKSPKVAFMGDSYTSGVGSTSKSSRWTTLLAAQLGWEELNYGQGGSGFTGRGVSTDGTDKLSYPEMIPAVVSAKPDMVVVATAGNDFNRGPESFEPAIAKFFTDLRAGLPTAKIVVVSPMWRGPESHEHLPELAAALKGGALSVKGTFVDIGSDFQTSYADGLLGADSIHPNDRGHAELAAEVAAAYKATTSAK